MSILFGSNWRATLIRSAVLIGAAVIVFGFVLLPIRMEGISMMPTYGGGINFANRFSYRWSAPERGEAVAVRMAGQSVVFVKRVVGMPGERLAIEAGVVLINGEPLIEPHVLYKTLWNMDEVTIGPDEYFLIGDNRGMSMKNHDFGKAKRDRIIGKMLF
jgi:signal peptidase I